MRNLLSVSLLVLLVAGCFETEHSPYARIHSGNFQVSSKSFVPENGSGPKVTLLGVIHIGEQSYYEAIQQRLNRADRVLYEEMGRGEELTEIRTEIAALCPEHSNVFPKEKEPGSYAKYAKVLDLVEQVTTIDYNQPHFRQADATLRQILLHKSPKNITLCTALRDNKERLKAALENEDPATQAFKKLGSSTSRNAMALALSKIITKDRVQSEKEGDMSNQFIIFDRNDIAFAALKKEISSFASGAEIVVFYGAAHLDDIERSLTGLGYKLDSTEWLSAFSL